MQVGFPPLFDSSRLKPLPSSRLARPARLAPHNKNPCEDELARIVSARRGDMEAFKPLVLGSQDPLFDAAVRMVGDTQLPAESIRDAFLMAFRVSTAVVVAGFRSGRCARLPALLRRAAPPALRRRARI
jgi:hypothetical protein